jgi:hypothetical protein
MSEQLELTLGLSKLMITQGFSLMGLLSMINGPQRIGEHILSLIHLLLVGMSFKLTFGRRLGELTLISSGKDQDLQKRIWKFHREVTLAIGSAMKRGTQHLVLAVILNY